MPHPQPTVGPGPTDEGIHCSTVPDGLPLGKVPASPMLTKRLVAAASMWFDSEGDGSIVSYGW
jgi:hypothetical protein